MCVRVCVSEQAYRAARRGRWAECWGNVWVAVARPSLRGTDRFLSGLVAAALLPSLSSSARL